MIKDEHDYYVQVLMKA